ncbi:MAG: phosphoglucomutase/phosphomannomutase family protein [Anaerolineales bacterium]|nr:phosphoglucomutase/phosphomannomutase family protein [Anaerolineales bacterium]
MMDVIRFGTDGWRGKIAEDYTFDNVRRCAQGFAEFLLAGGLGGRKVVVGHDRRFDSEHFAAASAEVLAGNGFSVLLTDGPSPTPTISFAIGHEQACGGINITASHNPGTDNGFKVRDSNGAAIAPDKLKQIEAAIPADLAKVRHTPFARALEQGSIRTFDPAPAYAEQIRRMLDLDALKRAPLKVLFDPMWGNGAGWLDRLLGGGRIEIVEIHSERNPLFPEMLRPEPIRPNVDAGLRATVEHKADGLIITDGDADRVGFGDEKGNFINQLQVYGLLALYMLEVRKLRGAIVKTLSTTSMLDKLGEKYNVPVHSTGVGFKYVAPKMIETDALIGGEESGGFAFRGHVPERDGILAGLFLLDMMVRLERKPSELVKYLYRQVGAEYFYDRIDLRLDPDQPGQREAAFARVTAARPESIAGLKVTARDDTDGFKFCMEDGGWLLVRFSGTEPIIRVYCETTHGDKVRAILEDGVRIAGLPRG